MRERGKNCLWVLMALFYDQFYQRFPPYQKLLREIIKNLNDSLSSSGSLLDDRSSTGLFSIEMARQGQEFLGTDSPRCQKGCKKADGKPG